MRYVYLLLFMSLAGSYGLALRRIIRSSSGINALLGWWVGLGYFIVAPLAVMTFVGHFELASGYEMGNYWREVDFRSADFFIPYAVIWLSLVAASFIICSLVPNRRAFEDSVYVFSKGRVERVLWISFSLMLLDWLFTIHAMGGIEGFVASHWYERGEDLVGQMGDSFVLIEHISMANQVVFTSAAALYTCLGLKSRNLSKAGVLLILGVFCLQMIMTGNRINLATYLIAVTVSGFLYARKRLLIGLMVLSPLLVVIFSAWAAVRHDLTEIPESVNTYVQGDFGNRATSALVDVTEGMDLLLLFHVIRDFGNRHEYLLGTSYSRALLSFLPRRVYPNKPETFTGYLAKLYVPNVLTSLNATALGEMYANFGPITLILFPLFTVGVVVLTDWAKASGAAYGLLSPVLFTLMFWTARSTFEDSFVLFALVLLLSFCFRMQKRLRIPVKQIHAEEVA
jgi:oligosaccharide repeat unit polymerase